MARYDILDREGLCLWCKRPYKKDGLLNGYCRPKCRFEANQAADLRDQEREEYRREAEEERRAHQAWIDSLSPEELKRLNAEREQKTLRRYAFFFGLLLAATLYNLGELTRVEAPDGTFWEVLSAYVNPVEANFATLSFWLVVLPAGLLFSEIPVLRKYFGRTMRVVMTSVGFFLLVSLIVYPISWFVQPVEQNRHEIIFGLAGLMSLMFAWTEIEGGNSEKIGTSTKPVEKPKAKTKPEPAKLSRGKVAKRALYSWLVAGLMLPILIVVGEIESNASAIAFLVSLIILIVAAGMGIGYSLGALFGIDVKKAET